MKTSLPSMLLVLLVNLSIGTCMEATPAQPPEWLYHYTSKANLLKIMESEQLKPSHDGAGGPGVYFTELSPDSSDDELLWNNYDGQLYVPLNGKAKMVEYAVGIRRKDLQNCKKLGWGSAGSRNVWMIEALNSPYLTHMPAAAPLPIDKLQYKTFRRGDDNAPDQAFKAERDMENTIRQLRQRITDLEGKTDDMSTLKAGDRVHHMANKEIKGVAVNELKIRIDNPANDPGYKLGQICDTESFVKVNEVSNSSAFQPHIFRTVFAIMFVLFLYNKLF